MDRVEIPCGLEMIEVELDDHMTVLRQDASAVRLEPQPDLAAGVRSALAAPLDRPPLDQQVRTGSRITIAFDDPTVPCYAPLWEEALGQIIDQLVRGGAKEERITLLCANALHRQFNPEELARTIGADLAQRFAGRLLCHDAEDADSIVSLGATPAGHPVELNRLAVDTDLCIYLNTSCWRAFNGGWKSICVGLSTYNSIRVHHSPDAMSMSVEKNRMHEVLDQMGALATEALGEDHFFKVETVLANPVQLGHMWAGSVPATRAKVLELMGQRGASRRDLLEDKADVVLYGVPEWSPYAAYAGMNPLLGLVSTGLGYLGGVIEAIGKPGCSVIMANPCGDSWDEVHHPSYREVWEQVLPDSRDPFEIRQRHEAAFARRPDYLRKYRSEYGFHPVHGIMATYPLKRLQHAAQIIVARTEAPHLARHLGFEPASTVEQALGLARETQGQEARVAVVRYPMAINRM